MGGGASSGIGVTSPSGRVGGRGELRTQVSLWSGLLLPGDLDTHHSPTRPPRLVSEHPLLLSLSCLVTPHPSQSPHPSQVWGHSPSPRLPPMHPCVFPFALLFWALKSADRLLLAPHRAVPPPSPALDSFSRGSKGGGVGGMLVRVGGGAEEGGSGSLNTGQARPYAPLHLSLGWLWFCPVSLDGNGGAGVRGRGWTRREIALGLEA